jgi:uncharacterized protein with von Willebrand factor type A (vWA) domain
MSSDGAAEPVRDVVETVTAFARTLRHSGVQASPDRVQAMIRAVGELDVLDASHVYWSGRLTLCGSHDDVQRYDAAFSAYFGGEAPRQVQTSAQPRKRVATSASLGIKNTDGQDSAEDAPDIAAAASGEEILRHRDIGLLSPDEREHLQQLFALLAPNPPLRQSRRRTPANRGSIHVARTVRRALHNGGEIVSLSRRKARQRPRRVVALLDVSGSMSPYADALMRFAHALTRAHQGSTEVFTVGTRLTRVTREMRLRDPDKALAASGAAIPDWSGGTRLGEVLKAFLDRWGQRGVARGAVVILASDGWERGDPDQLAEQMARLHRLAHRVIWVNPHKGREGYEPLTRGMAAALPYVDSFVSGHSLAAFEELAEEIADA